MRCLLALQLFIVKTLSLMPYNVCFQIRTDNSLAKTVLQTVDADTERACQIACYDDKKCSGVKYNALSTPPLCQFYGDQDVYSCSATLDVYSKYDMMGGGTACDDRTNATVEFGRDPCVDQLFPTLTNIDAGMQVCPQDASNLIIRGVDESGKRVTLDNEAMNQLTYDKSRRMWMFTYTTTSKQVFLSAVSCATTNSKCACEDLPMTDATYGKTFANGVMAQTGVKGLCADPTHTCSFYFGKANGVMQNSFNPSQAPNFRASCQAGIWLLWDQAGTYVGQIANATCHP